MADSGTESLTDRVSRLRHRVNELRRAGDLVALLTAAEAAADEIERRVGPSWDDTAREALMVVKRLTYNASADCWPGWSVSTEQPSTDVLVRALELAKRSVGLVRKLGLGRLQEGTGVWLSGAHELALGRYTDAHSAFILARGHYIAARAPGLTLLTQGYIAIVCQIAADQLPACPEDLDDICARISAGAFEDGAEWIEQLHTARKAFT